MHNKYKMAGQNTIQDKKKYIPNNSSKISTKTKKNNLLDIDELIKSSMSNKSYVEIASIIFFKKLTKYLKDS